MVDAVDFVEATLPTLCNKAFRTLVKSVDNQRAFRVATLLGVLSKWYGRALSVENAVRVCYVSPCNATI